MKRGYLHTQAISHGRLDLKIATRRPNKVITPKVGINQIDINRMPLRRVGARFSRLAGVILLCESVNSIDKGRLNPLVPSKIWNPEFGLGLTGKYNSIILLKWCKYPWRPCFPRNRCQISNLDPISPMESHSADVDELSVMLNTKYPQVWNTTVNYSIHLKSSQISVYMRKLHEKEV